MKILYIADHLSTGGMPEVLKQRVYSLHSLSVDVWVLEYSLYSNYYTTQRDLIKALLGDKFISIGTFSTDSTILDYKFNKIKELLNRENFDIIHFENPIENYDNFNGVSDKLVDYIYNPNRSWKIVETIHSSNFNGNTSKKWIPDAIMHCSEYTKNITFSKFNNIIPTTVIEYPIWDRTYEQYERPIEFDTNMYNVVNIGIWTPGKNQKEAVEIAKYLDIHYPNKYLFHFIGAVAPNFQNYWKPILDTLPKNVKVWDSQSDIGRFYQHADLILFNSTNELNPIVLKEAVSYKKPLLIRKLAVYGNLYDKYANYLTGVVQIDANNIPTIINNSNDVEYKLPNISKMGNDMIKFYETINSVNQTYIPPISRNINFLDGAYVELKGDSNCGDYDVQFIDNNSNGVVYSTKLSPNHWSKTLVKYYVNWKIKISSHTFNDNSFEYTLDLNNKIVEIRFESAALGDTLAWIPYVEEFRKKHNCIIYCSTFHNHLFVDTYPNINFIQPTDSVTNPTVKYKLGWFYDETGKLDVMWHKNEIVNQPLQKTASDILGITYEEIRPTIKTYDYNGELPNRYFTFSLQSTAQSKYWNYKNGWYDLLELLKSSGLVGVCIDKSPSFGNSEYMNYMPSNSVDKTGLSLEETIGIIDKAEFHIGISSGLSWLSWAVGKPTVLISGFTIPDLEFTEGCIRIHNDIVCNGCFSNPLHTFDRGDWSWCPVHKGTDRQFECTKVITPLHIFNKIKENGLL
jgi:autotransporter strand-loop-strand O-heptosyltransferase